MSGSEKICVTSSKKSIKGTVHLTGSKSASNRALIMQALSEGKVNIENLSKAADTVTLNEILVSIGGKVEGGKVEGEKGEGKKGEGGKGEGGKVEGGKVVDVGPAGTAMRFLTAYAAMIPGEIILTGSERMQQRPIG
ncbi:MAG TPA: hypothetical protein VLZ28_03365, partial [Daejeonella sp.]|nr:hypothetical protein [Daejeonella sp.]